MSSTLFVYIDVYTLEQIMQSKKVHEPLTFLQCCPTSDGAGAAVLCNENFVYKYGLQDKAIEVVGMYIYIYYLIYISRYIYIYSHSPIHIYLCICIGMSMATDLATTFNSSSMIKCVGFDMAQHAASLAYKQAGITANDIQVIELHDCFSANELLTYEALGLCPIGGAAKFIDDGDNTYGK